MNSDAFSPKRTMVVPVRLQRLGRWRALISILMVGGLLSCLAFAYAYHLDERRIRNVLDFRAQWRAQDLQAKIVAAVAPIEAVATLVNSVDVVDPVQFHRFAAPKQDVDKTRVIAWAPYVAGEDRQRFEQAVEQADKEPFSIAEWKSEGAVGPAGERDFYLPIMLEEHASGATIRLKGLDILAEQTRRGVILQAIASGQPVASPPVKPLRRPQDPPRYLILWPVFSAVPDGATPEERRHHLRGFVIGGVDFVSLLTNAIKDTPTIPEEITLTIDGAAPGDEFVAKYSPDSGAFSIAPRVDDLPRRSSGSIVVDRNFVVLGRHWTMLFRFPPAIVVGLRSSSPALWFLAGILLTTLVALYADRERFTRMRVEELVELRTGQLSVATEVLHQEASDRVRAEIALRHHAQLLEKTLEASPLAIIHLAPDRTVLVWNLGAEALFGYTSGEIVGCLLPISLEVATIEPHTDLFAQLRSGAAIRSCALELLNRGGAVVKVKLSAEPVFEDGQFTGSVMVIEDRTDHHALEEQLRQSQKMEAIGQLTGGMAHDFNNLLLVILGNISLVVDTLEEGDPNADLCREAREAALRGAALIRSLLAFARRQPLRPAQVSLNGLIAEQMVLLQRTLGERIEVSTNLMDGLWPVMVDPAQLEAALINLATNARDAMPKGGKLRIVTQNRHLDSDYAEAHPEVSPGDHAMIEVSDTGTGMTTETISHIFEPFFTTKERGDGTGLGLSMVFGFMKQSGGHINVYSEVGVGTTFRLFLPRAQTVVERGASIKTVAMPKGNGETILLVEDNESIRRLATRQITLLGYHPYDVGDAQQAITYLESGEKVDLLFTDVVMPGKTDGLDLVRIVRERWPHIAILMTSGFTNSEHEAASPASLGFKLLSKPYQRDELARALRDALDDRN